MANINPAAANPSRTTHGDPARAEDRPFGIDLTPDKWWVALILGLLFIAGGLYMVLNAVAASIATTILFGAILAVGGVFQIAHAFWQPTWRDRVLSIVIGLLYAGSGVLLLLNPLAGSLALTLTFAALFVVGGVLRFVLAYRLWGRAGWLLVLSGLIAIATGVIIFLGWPWSGLVVPGLMLGIDMAFHGSWWLALGFALRRERPALGAARPARA